jgi:hypothetical protein
MNKKAKEVVKNATKTVNTPGAKEKGYTYFQQADGSTKRVRFTDATGEVSLECKKADIDKAVCGDPMNCVMARMFIRTFGPLCTEVRVGKKYMHVVQGTGDMQHAIRFAVKGKLKKAIHEFDVSKGARGFTAVDIYVICPPAPTDKRNGREKGVYGAHNGRGAKNRLVENRQPIRPTRNIFCFTTPERPLFPAK